MYLLYSFLTLLLLPVFALRGWLRGKSEFHLRERLGELPPAVRVATQGASGAIWVHAVSVGEVLAGLPLARRLKERFPGRKLFISTTTPTGQQLARERMNFADGIFYFPLDFSASVRRVFQQLKPAALVILETEIWPNLLHEARRENVPVLFVNGRISEKSFGRYRALNGILGGFLGRVLEDAALFLMQSEGDAQRLLALGAAEDRVEVTGNLKYDLAPPGSSGVADWLEKQVEAQERWPLIVAGSVVEDEEEPVLAAFDVVERKWRHALLVLAPRKPERFDAAARIAEERGWKVARRSRVSLDAPLDEDADLLLLDSMGELAGMYRLADAVFVGGSLVPAGGHNILEPAWFARPPVFGAHMQNFREMAAEFLSAGAAVQVANERELGEAWVKLIEEKAQSERMGRAARALVERNRGATERSLERIAAALDASARAAGGRR